MFVFGLLLLGMLTLMKASKVTAFEKLRSADNPVEMEQCVHAGLHVKKKECNTNILVGKTSK